MDRVKFGYEDTDSNIEIELYGLVFKIKNISNLEELKELKEIGNNENEIENALEKILGEGSIEKINNKRKEDGYEPMDMMIELNIFGLIFEVVAKNITSGITDKIDKSINSVNEKMNNTINNMNRNYRRNKGNYRRNYRRY